MNLFRIDPLILLYAVALHETYATARYQNALQLAGIKYSHQTIEDTLWRAKRLADRAGISMDVAKMAVEKDQSSPQDGMPSSVSLLGLIPIGVGVAYLVFYYTGDKQRTGSNGQ